MTAYRFCIFRFFFQVEVQVNSVLMVVNIGERIEQAEGLVAYRQRP